MEGHEAVVTVVNPNKVETSEAGVRIYEALQGAGIDVLLDDRDERPGVKFKDAELIGIPYRITIGPKGLAQGVVEFVRRATGDARELPLQHAAETTAEQVFDERR